MWQIRSSHHSWLEHPSRKGWPRRGVDILLGVVTASICTGLGWLCRGWGNLSFFVMLFLVGAVLTALWRGRLASAVAVVLGLLSFDYFFETPAFSFSVANWPDFMAFTGFLAISQLVASLVYQLRMQTREAQLKEREASALAEEAERAHTRAELERTRSTLLSAISHDFRTPLSTIHGAAATLAQEAEVTASPELRDLAGLIVEESSRLGHLIGNLLDLTRLEAGTLRLNLETQPLEEVLGTVLTRLEPLLGPVEVDLPDELPPVPLDSVLVEQLLTNLLENAFRHGSGRGVRLEAEEQPGAVMVKVSDEGPGIPEALREHVFEKFYRQPGASSDGGVGLGLAICQAIVRLHGGDIWIEETPGGGASFRFTLPLPRADHGTRELP